MCASIDSQRTSNYAAQEVIGEIAGALGEDRFGLAERGLEVGRLPGLHVEDRDLEHHGLANHDDVDAHLQSLPDPICGDSGDTELAGEGEAGTVAQRQPVCASG